MVLVHLVVTDVFLWIIFQVIHRGFMIHENWSEPSHEISSEVRAFNKMVNWLYWIITPGSVERTTLDYLRWFISIFDEASMHPPLPDEVISLTEVNANGIKCILVEHQNLKNETTPVILIAHGGGFLLGTARASAKINSHWLSKFPSKALIVDYRLAPEHTLDESRDDILNAYKWLIMVKNIDPKLITIAGDSAGGNLALRTLIEIRDLNLPAPACGVLISPWADLTLSQPSFTANAKYDVFLNELILDVVLTKYPPWRNHNPKLYSPLHMDLTRLPPLFITTGTYERLIDENTALVEKLKQSGVETQWDVKKGHPHAFPLFCSYLPEAKTTVHNMVHFIQGHTILKQNYIK